MRSPAPVAETDLLAAWLAGEASLEGSRIRAVDNRIDRRQRARRTAHRNRARAVPWTRRRRGCAGRPNRRELLVTAVSPDDLSVTDGHNLGGEPRDDVELSICPPTISPDSIPAVADELTRRGAWARCVQCIGALDAAAELSVAHTRERVQFGRPLSKFQAVQHSLAQMAGEIERARAATELAVAAATDHGFDRPQTDYAVTVAKVVLGRVVPAVSTVAHQVHGAIGVTIEHPLWSATNRAHSWIDEFGSTGHYARRLGRLALEHGGDAGGLWDVLTSGAPAAGGE